MNKKGFTLIELLGIVLILALIFSLSFPAYLNMIKKTKEDKANQLKEDLCLAGETYLYENETETSIRTFFQNKTSIDVLVTTLISEDLMW